MGKPGRFVNVRSLCSSEILIGTHGATTEMQIADLNCNLFDLYLNFIL